MANESKARPGPTGAIIKHGQLDVTVAADNTITVGSGGAALLMDKYQMKVDTDNIIKANGVPILQGQIQLRSV